MYSWYILIFSTERIQVSCKRRRVKTLWEYLCLAQFRSDQIRWAACGNRKACGQTNLPPQIFLNICTKYIHVKLIYLIRVQGYFQSPMFHNIIWHQDLWGSSERLCVLSDKFGHFVICLASGNQGAQFDSSNFLRGQFFFQPAPPSSCLVLSHHRRFSVIWLSSTGLKDTSNDFLMLVTIIPLRDQNHHHCCFDWNWLMFSWLLGGQLEGQTCLTLGRSLLKPCPHFLLPSS